MPFVLLVMLVVTALVGAGVARFNQTARFLKLGPDHSVARALADSGLELAVILMRDEAYDWYTGYSQPIRNTDLGLSDASLGGGFELEFRSFSNLYPAGGSFITIRSQGRSGSRTATSVATIKLTSMLANYLFFSNGSYTMSGFHAPANSGPILVNGNGDEGNFRFWHDWLNERALTPQFMHSHEDVEFSGSVRASGSVVLSNQIDGPLRSRGVTHTLPPRRFNGTVAAGTMVHQDLPGLAAQGSLTFTSEVEVETDAPLRVLPPAVDAVLNAAARQPGVRTIDVGQYPEGVLAEFIGGKLVLSEVRRTPVGVVFDKDVYLGQTTELRNQMGVHHGSSDPAAMDQLLRNEVAWDDPDFPELPYPSDLVGDTDGDGVVETEGDYFELGHITRGPAIPGGTFTLDRSRFTFVQLVTDRTDHPGPQGEQAPAVFVRGIVEGKVNLSYTVSDPALDPNYDRLSVVVLNQHEDPVRPATTRIAPAGLPGVPGGLRFQDPSMRLEPTDTSPASPDALILTSRGQIGASGSIGFMKSRVHDTSGNVFNYAQELRDLDQQYTSAFSSGPWGPDEFNVQAGGLIRPRAALQGIFAATSIDFERDRMRADGLLAPDWRGQRGYPFWDRRIEWNDFSQPWAPGAVSGRSPLLGIRFRNARTPDSAMDVLKGSYSSLGSNLKAGKGERRFDYAWRDLSVDQIAEAGLPIDAILCTWQRL